MAADHPDDPGGVPAVPGAEEVGNRVGAELAEVWPEEHGEQQVAARPAHDVGEAGETLRGQGPAIEMNEAADIQSEPVAMPL